LPIAQLPHCPIAESHEKVLHLILTRFQPGETVPFGFPTDATGLPVEVPLLLQNPQVLYFAAGAEITLKIFNQRFGKLPPAPAAKKIGPVNC